MLLRRAATLLSSAATASLSTPRLSLPLVRSLHSSPSMLLAIDRSALLRRLSDEKSRPSAGKARAAESAAADTKAKELEDKAAIEAAWAKVEAEMTEEYERTGGASPRPPRNAREREREQERRARGGAAGSGPQRGDASSPDAQSLDPKLRRRPRREPGAASPHKGKGALREEWNLERVRKICRELLEAGRAGENLNPELKAKYMSFKANIEAEVVRTKQLEAERMAMEGTTPAAAAPTVAGGAGTDAAATPAAAASSSAAAASASPSPSAVAGAASASAAAAAAAPFDPARPRAPPSISPPELRVSQASTLDGVSMGADGVLEYAFPRLNSFERHIVHTTADFLGQGEITHGSVGEGLHRHIVLRYVGKEAAERAKKEKAEAEAAAKQAQVQAQASSQ